MHLTGCSTAQIATWICLPGFRMLIDAGDGAAAGLGRRCRDIDTIAITHQHRDHIAGLLEVLSWSAYRKPCSVLYPAGSDVVEAIRDAAGPQGVSCAVDARWVPVVPGQELTLTANGGGAAGAPEPRSPARVVVFPAAHAVQKQPDRAVGYALADDDRIRLAVTGDCGAGPLALPGRPEILVRDCMYLRAADGGGWADAFRQHGRLDAILDQIGDGPPDHLVLYHLDARYTSREASAWIRAACRERQLPCAVSVIWPGEPADDIIARTVWDE
jgi:ribonuclease BN (tRNA processing enzyme)